MAGNIFTHIAFASNAKIIKEAETVVENILLVDLMKRNNKSYLFYFFPFENDANFSALLLMKNNIKVHKVPGPNSLFHNHKMFISERGAF